MKLLVNISSQMQFLYINNTVHGISIKIAYFIFLISHIYTDKYVNLIFELN